MFELKFNEIDRFNVKSEVTILFGKKEDLQYFIEKNCNEWISWEVSYK